MARERHNVEAVRDRMQVAFDALNGESDVICAVVSVSYLEQSLAALLRKALIQHSAANGFIDNGLQRKTDLAFCLGLISEGCRNNLNVLGQIRNRFAHGIDSESFSDEGIANLCKQLTMPVSQVVTVSLAPAIDPIDFESPRLRFSTIVSSLCMYLVIQGLQVEQRTVMTDYWQ